MSYTPIFDDAFASKISIDDTTGCWNWTGSVDSNGYGTMTRRGMPFKTHRFMWQGFNGQVPAGMEIDHECRNRRCVNPNHLRPMTHADNVRRSRRDVARCGHPFDLEESNGRWRARRCSTCRSEQARARRARVV